MAGFLFGAGAYHTQRSWHPPPCLYERQPLKQGLLDWGRAHVKILRWKPPLADTPERTPIEGADDTLDEQRAPRSLIILVAPSDTPKVRGTDSPRASCKAGSADKTWLGEWQDLVVSQGTIGRLVG